ncbi:MAG: response regulator transcription factor [Anaerolineae bacterium]|nr:response regulator transcription factor [Anaerolineae bacterium]
MRFAAWVHLAPTGSAATASTSPGASSALTALSSRDLASAMASRAEPPPGPRQAASGSSRDPSASEESVPDLERGTPVILVVDDDPSLVHMYTRFLERASFRALQACHGRAALEVLERTRPDLILLDLEMPEMDGFAVLDALRGRESMQRIPVIVLTGHMPGEDEIGRLHRSAAMVLAKGLFSPDEVLECVRKVLAESCVLGSPARSLVRCAIGFIHGHYAEPLTRQQIAKHVYASAGYLSNCFRRELGLTPMEYLRRYRVLRACELLESTDQTITLIAFAVGFCDSAHFSRVFRRLVGVTPRAYRRGERAGIVSVPCLGR